MTHRYLVYTRIGNHINTLTAMVVMTIYQDFYVTTTNLTTSTSVNRSTPSVVTLDFTNSTESIYPNRTLHDPSNFS